MLQPRVAIGVPVFNRAHQVREAIRSILTQSYRDFQVIAVDDGSTDETPSILERLAADNPRLTYLRNERRLGYTVNARATYDLCCKKYPSIEFFAWGSDHDLWHPQWLELLVKQLDEVPDAMMACSWNHHVTDAGDIVASNRFPQMDEPAASGSVIDRVRFAAHGLAAGDFIYGLIRVAALQRTSGLRRVLEPDRLLLAELSTLGRVSMVPEYLWRRRRSVRASHARQRRNSFPGRAPLYTYLPIIVQHGLVLFQDFIIRRLGRPEISTFTGWQVAFSYLQERYRANRRRRLYRAEREKERRVRQDAKARYMREKQLAESQYLQEKQHAESQYLQEKQRLLEEAAALKARLREGARDLREKRQEAAALKARPGEALQGLRSKRQEHAALKARLGDEFRDLQAKRQEAAALEARLGEELQHLEARRQEPAALKVRLSEEAQSLQAKAVRQR